MLKSATPKLLFSLLLLYQLVAQSAVSTALLSECSIIYSEDMQHNQLIENKLKIINPFV
ncbi:hypothetical protein NIES23_02510 [Trichormus variabilis NIES-23]|uniref:Uncharacterized protein n=1 Tax=Trichormus variabilis NIES-23 TaxID=1973479 RepID=A0A1Z4KEY2_ANAVA|nr:hypothetical protein NIES23_02510 [Trichormus variabilis NIES-23]